MSKSIALHPWRAKLRPVSRLKRIYAIPNTDPLCSRISRRNCWLMKSAIRSLDILGEPICLKRLKLDHLAAAPTAVGRPRNPERIAITQPRVARNELPWVDVAKCLQP